jgi:catechol-2,3-dioxygenase
MSTLNHTNLTTYNVPELKDFFCSIFNFDVSEMRGDKLAVLRNADNFILTLMFDKNMTPEQGYPGIFHVGFIQADEPAVDRLHQKLGEFKYDAPKPEILTRGGPPTYGFYYKAPGGVLVEVSTMNVSTGETA